MAPINDSINDSINGIHLLGPLCLCVPMISYVDFVR